MNELLRQVFELKKSSVGKKVEQRLKEFKAFKNKGADDWFSELCFCLLTANSKASTAISVHDELGFKGFSEYSHEVLSSCIRKNKHRFHNNKAKYIVEARDYLNIKWVISGLVYEEGAFGAREWLVENVLGLGYKESSHFLRNVGFTDVAVLDRHIINLMLEHKVLKAKPKNLERRNYIEIEKKFKELSEEADMSMAELDLYMWCLKTGEVLR